MFRNRKPLWICCYRLGIAFSLQPYRVRYDSDGVWIKHRFGLWLLQPSEDRNGRLAA